MPAIHAISVISSTPATGAVDGLGQFDLPWVSLPPEMVSALPGCCRNPNARFTRGELAALFNVSTKTIARWEAADGLPHERTNARVIRYTVETVLRIVAMGVSIDREQCEHLGLHVAEILALASALRPVKTGNGSTEPKSTDVVYIAKSDTDRMVIELLRDPTRGDYLRAVAAAILGVRK